MIAASFARAAADGPGGRLRRRRAARRARLPARPVPLAASPTGGPTATAATSPAGCGSAPRSPPPSGRRSARTSRSPSGSRSGRAATTTPGSPRTRPSWRPSSTPLAEAGVSMFHVSTRRYWLPAFDGSDRTLAGWTRHLTGLPVITVGSVGVAAAFRRPGRGPRLPSLTLAPLVDLLEPRRVRPGRGRPRRARRPRVGRQGRRRPAGGDPPLRQVRQLDPVLTHRETRVAQIFLYSPSTS